MASEKSRTAQSTAMKDHTELASSRLDSEQVGSVEPAQGPELKSSSKEQNDLESSTEAMVKGKVACKFFKQGHCFRGVTCWYSHEVALAGTTVLEPNAPVFVPRNLGPSTSSEPTLVPCHSGLGLNYDLDLSLGSEVEACSICFEDKPVTYGLLSNCSHTYCLQCIREWRATKDKPDLRRGALATLGPHKSCPLCRTVSLYIIPSRYFYKEGLAKSACVERYRRALQRKPCKYFEKSLDDADEARRSSQVSSDPPDDKPYCPFGRDCFYSHRLRDGTDYVFEDGAETLFNKRRLNRHRHHQRRLRAQFGFGAESDDDGGEGEWGEQEEEHEDEEEDEDEDRVLYLEALADVFRSSRHVSAEEAYYQMLLNVERRRRAEGLYDYEDYDDEIELW